MHSGLRRPTLDKRDFDFHKSFGSVPTQFPAEYSVDAGLWNPNQDNTNAEMGLNVIPPLPFGCTDYTQTDLCIDEDGHLLDPMLLENETHANAMGGLDIRVALKAAIKVFQRTAYFNIRAQAPLDMFDAIRLAMLSTASEKRAVSAGTPFFPEWMVEGILPTPQNFSLSRASWHNWKIAGWKTFNGEPYLICKMWTGDWKYMSRPLCNQLFAINGSVAYTLSKTAPAQIQTIDWSFVEWLVSFFHSLFTPQTSPVAAPEALITNEAPQPAPEPTSDWSTRRGAYHNTRVLCDQAGLTLAEKNLICACIFQESQFSNAATNKNKVNGVVVSTDYGLCQVNDHYHIGKGKDFPSVEYVLAHPEKAVQWMITMYKHGNLKMWVSYSSGAYRKWLLPISPMWLL